ncbi:MAG TPA: OsmC family protein [Candidatus Limnocylindrales bacterium]|nr:OsmC family protein [Candidatus Limnocylindrales bacterium]
MSSVSIMATFADPASGMRMAAESGSGFTIEFDSADAGDARAGAAPIEVVLAALAGCTAMDVASILRKKRQVPVSYQVSVSGERAEEHPQVFTAITVEHRVTGDVEPEAVRRSVELSATRYCPVSAMLSASVRIEHRYRLARNAQDEEPVSALVVVTGPG